MKFDLLMLSLSKKKEYLFHECFIFTGLYTLGENNYFMHQRTRSKSNVRVIFNLDDLREYY